ncbi:hypothetical protein EH165_02650 [Nakamurella antarctica]|uniref:Uncharacterized protein n=1 Tax=Nakamurella antarctica TaxID=1902245 RepID=A0A3G8ZJ28_9ACTN|nr:DUF6308 family protein [Nakamurella antarctica]AZI57220.1 hypothetical protein EH165_02650 [Nakamurella antarctica]
MSEGANQTDKTLIHIGGVGIGRELVLTAAREYLAAQGGRFGYPAYDAFEAGGGPGRISDGDFLAPALLNAPVNIKAFYSLESIRLQLEGWLKKVPVDARLVDAGSDGLALLGELFSVLDAKPRLPHARGSVLAKVMHRKRPAFVPLYDRYVDFCYRGSENAPISVDRGRTWQQFAPLLGQAMINDLQRERDFLAEVVALAQGPVITPLRALDILAWQAGRTSSPKPGLWTKSLASGEAAGDSEASDPFVDEVDEDDEAH